MRELMDKAGLWVITFLCCGWPALWAVVAVWAVKRYETYGIAGFLPSIRVRRRYDQ